MKWKDIKEKVEKQDIKLDKDSLDQETGSCLVDIIKGPYKGYSVEGLFEIKLGEKILTMLDDAIVYIPIEDMPEEENIEEDIVKTIRKTVNYDDK